MTPEEKRALQLTAVSVREGILTSTHGAKAGHPGGSLSAADVFTYLYFKEMRIDPKAPRWEDRDRFVLSKGHTAPGLYAALALRGYFPVEELPRLRKVFHKPVMANVSGFSVADYARTCALLDREEQVGWLEVNISCPNVHGGGMSFGTSPEMAAEVTRAVKEVTVKPVYMKLSPNVMDIAAIALACEEAGADGVSLINTLQAMRLDLKRRRPVLANQTGGLSGPAIFPVAVRMVYQTAQAVKLPIIGMGGVSTAEDVIELMLAGATAVEVGAANLTDPFVCRDIIAGLPGVMERYGIQDLKEIRGGAHYG